MSRPKLALLAGLALLLVIGVWIPRQRSLPRLGEQSSSTPAASSQEAEPAPRATPAPFSPAGATPRAVLSSAATPAPVAATPHVYVPPEPPPAPGSERLDQIGMMLRDYRTVFHENPVGSNAEIMRSIMGGNPKSARLGPPPGMELNQEGELLDQWGTPIFFHALSRDHMELRSAGPDRIMWNGDDVVQP